MSAVKDVVGRDGIGVAAVFGAEIDDYNVGELEDEPAIVLSRDIGWFIAFICVFGLALSAVYMMVKKCRKRHLDLEAKTINWSELEMGASVPNSARSVKDSANISASALQTPNKNIPIAADNSHVQDDSSLVDISVRMDARLQARNDALHQNSNQFSGTPQTDDITINGE